MENIEEVINSFFDLALLTSKPQRENEMRKENKFCDLTLVINDKDEFKVHKTIIASSCSYFSGLLSGDWKESMENVISLDYKIIPECFEIILEYLYTGKLGITNISVENGAIIHEGAVFFNLIKLKEVISRILEKFISDENVLELFHHSVKFFDQNLRDKCAAYISDHYLFFKTILLKLNFVELKNLYGINKVKWSHEEMYETLTKWIKVDFDLREKHLKDLLDLVDFSKISGKFVQSNILSDKILYKNVDFVEKIMIEAGRRIEFPIAISTKQFNILLISNTGIFKIDLDDKKCLPLLNHKINREDFAVNNFGFNNILISGGLDSNVCEYYSPDLNLFRKFPPMLEKRWGHTVVAVDDKIYAFGGYENDTMEIFDINTGKWNYGPKMPRKSWNFIIEEDDGGIYVMYGEGIISTDLFDIKTAEWTSIPDYKPSITKAERFQSRKSHFRLYLFKNKQQHLYEYYSSEELSTYDIVGSLDLFLVLGKIKNSDKFYSALFDKETMEETMIQIDFSQCDDIGNDFCLKHVYL